MYGLDANDETTDIKIETNLTHNTDIQLYMNINRKNRDINA